MTPHRCAMPDCQNDATGIFCADHYFHLPPKDAKWLVRLQIMIARSDDAELKSHLREQLHGYTQQAVRTLRAAEARDRAVAITESQKCPAGQHVYVPGYGPIYVPLKEGPANA